MSDERAARIAAFNERHTTFFAAYQIVPPDDMRAENDIAWLVSELRSALAEMAAVKLEILDHFYGRADERVRNWRIDEGE